MYLDVRRHQRVSESPADQVGGGGDDDRGRVNNIFRLLRSFIRLDCDTSQAWEPRNMRELPRGTDLCAMKRWIN